MWVACIKPDTYTKEHAHSALLTAFSVYLCGTFPSLPFLGGAAFPPPPPLGDAVFPPASFREEGAGGVWRYCFSPSFFGVVVLSSPSIGVVLPFDVVQYVLLN